MRTYKVKKGLISQKLGDKLTIFDSNKSILYTFNSTALFIFNQIKLGKDKNAIITKMISTYEIGKSRAEADFNILIEDLKLKKIIV